MHAIVTHDVDSGNTRAGLAAGNCRKQAPSWLPMALLHITASNTISVVDDVNLIVKIVLCAQGKGCVWQLRMR